jgi:hypothetical protein
MNHYLTQILLLMNDNKWEIHKFTQKGVLLQILQKGGWLGSKTMSSKVILWTILPTTTSYFIFTFVKKKEIINIILTLQMAQAQSFSKSKLEIIFNVVVSTLHHAWPSFFCPFLTSAQNDRLDCRLRGV